MITHFINWLHAQLGYIYVWGAQGEDLAAMKDPVAWIRKREKNDEKQIARVLQQYNAKLGQRPLLAYDCSGLIVHWTSDLMGLTKGDMSADTLYKQYGRGKLNASQIIPGDLVFIQSGGKMAHVGVYVGDGYTIEAYGRDRGVVKLPLSSGGWTHMGRFPFLEADKPPLWTVARVLKIAAPYLKGDDVRELQQRIYDYGIKSVVVREKAQTLTADGTFGPITEAAVRLYQRAQALAVDGKAGKNTITKLGGVWAG